MTTGAPVRSKDFLSVLDFDHTELEACLALAERLKRDRPLGLKAPTAAALQGAHIALLFDKPSLRTRSTFEIAIRELGGHVITPFADVALGEREPAKDVARNIERWVKAAIIRTFAHATLLEFAKAAPRLHVINALSDQEHPCQALADFMTLKEHWGAFRGQTLAFVGDGNNVATSLVQAGAMLGVNVHVASPPGYQLPSAVVEQALQVARHGARVRLFTDPIQAVTGADAVYTDVWTSMGQEAESSVRLEAFKHHQVTHGLMQHAAPSGLFMHCLPAHRGEEVTAEVFESPASVVFDQAENRLHAQKALLYMLVAERQERVEG
jgi:ornithine carbamoyltransferase